MLQLRRRRQRQTRVFVVLVNSRRRQFAALISVVVKLSVILSRTIIYSMQNITHLIRVSLNLYSISTNTRASIDSFS